MAVPNMGETRTRTDAAYNGLRALAETLSAVVAPLAGRRSFAIARVALEWPKIVGEHLANRSVPMKIIAPLGARGAGTLNVRIASGALALEMQHNEPLIVERINTFFGYAAVARLRLIHGPVPDRRQSLRLPRPLSGDAVAAVDGLVAGISDPELRESLKNIGLRVFVIDK
ncbi:MAG: DUF721 domain-containing protein [Rhodospirillales bacterium]|nr:DUF721 domain-containing protein [Rhodospirillales bacterium]